jgi:hypothetical protein
LQIATSSSTEITSTSLNVSYLIAPLWTITGVFGFTHVDNLGSPIWNDSFVADAQLSYQMRQNLTLLWEYQYTAIVTNTPLASTSRNLVSMSASYKF